MADPQSEPSWTLQLLNVPGWLDRLRRGLEAVPGVVGRVLEAARRMGRPWDAQKAADIRDKFRPHEPDSGMGCMAACYDVLGILYGADVATEIRKAVYKQALDKAKAYARRHPEVLNAHIERLKAAAEADGKTLTDAQAKARALDLMTSPYNSVDHLMGVLQDRGLAAEPSVLEYRGSGTWSPNAEDTIRQMIPPGQPGTYFFGVSVSSGNHTVTLAVEVAADGTQKTFWLDQHETGLSNEVSDLGSELERAQGSNSSTTRIWALQPPPAPPAPAAGP